MTSENAARPRITVLGTGYLGTAHAACLAELGFEVLGVDVNPVRVDSLSRGQLPFYEPDLEPLLQAGLKSGRARVLDLVRGRRRLR